MQFVQRSVKLIRPALELNVDLGAARKTCSASGLLVTTLTDWMTSVEGTAVE